MVMNYFLYFHVFSFVNEPPVENGTYLFFGWHIEGSRGVQHGFLSVVKHLTDVL